MQLDDGFWRFVPSIYVQGFGGNCFPHLPGSGSHVPGAVFMHRFH
jgi:hypothetical protein